MILPPQLLALCALLLATLPCVQSLLSDAPDRKYAARCEVSGGQREDGVGLPCQCSLFSYYNFEVAGQVGMLPESCNLCDTSGDKDACRRANVQVAAVLRGGCSFDTKATNAKKLGYHALIIVNNSPKESAFPMGAQDSGYTSSIPVVMMHYDSREYLASSEVIKIVLDHAKAPNSDSHDNNGVFLGSIAGYLPVVLQYCGPAILVCLVLLVSTPFKLQWLGGERRHHILTALLVVLFLLTRLGTFRRMQAGSGDGSAEYHHQETDERIFAALVDTVERNFFDYSLQSSGMVARLGLAVENYGDNIFIHPPLFVYALYGLKVAVGAPLPASILLLQTGTLLLVRQLTLLVASRFGADLPSARSTALMAMAIYASCPLAAFCSQKIWIDNMLCFSCALCGYLHLRMWMPVTMSMSPSTAPIAPPPHVSPSASTSTSTSTSTSGSGIGGETALGTAWRALASGTLFGLVVLNCKVTGLALAPFLVVTMTYSTWISHANNRYISGGVGRAGGNVDALPLWSRAKLTAKQSAVPALCFVLGAISMHGPWVWCYYRATGRLLPNAWPSPALIARNAFLQKAVSHPPTYYLSTILRFSPVMTVGLLAAAVRPSVVWFLHKRSRIGSRGEVRKAWWCVALGLWPAGFLAGLTLLGMCGAGYQARFILPIMPATAVLSALHLATVTSPSTTTTTTTTAMSTSASVTAGLGKKVGGGGGGDGSSGSGGGECAESEASVKGTVLALLLSYSSMHMLYYAVLMPTLHADMDVSLFDAVATALGHAYAPVGSEACMRDLLSFLRHLGIRLG